MSISSSLASLEWQGKKGQRPRHAGRAKLHRDAFGALARGRVGHIRVNAVMGVEVGTERLWERASELGACRGWVS